MKYQKNLIWKQSGFLVVLAIIVVCALIFLIRSLVKDFSMIAFLLPLFALAYCGFNLWAISLALINTVKQYKAVKSSGLLDILETINPYSSNSEMYSAAKRERENTLYKDSEIFITEHFLGSGTFVLLLDGILDANITVHNTNGITDRIELSILYYDGEKTSFDYPRPIGFSGSEAMQTQVLRLEYALKLIADRSKLFRKFDCCQL